MGCEVIAAACFVVVTVEHAMPRRVGGEYMVTSPTVHRVETALPQVMVVMGRWRQSKMDMMTRKHG